MGIIDSFLINDQNILKGLDSVRGIGDYLFAKKGDQVICFTYQGDSGDKLLKHYLQENHIDSTNLNFEKKRLKTKQLEQENLLSKKLCFLDKRIVLFEEVVRHNKTHSIKGYKEGKLKNCFNIFTTINER